MMDVMPSSEDEHPSKRQRFGEGPQIVESIEEVTDIPELNRIKQSGSQLAYLQAQLAASETLYAAYEAELQVLAKDLGDVKRSHVQSGQSLWKDAGLVTEASRRHRRLAAAGNCEDDLDTFSDMEEEVLLLEPESQTEEQQRRQRQGLTRPCSSELGASAPAAEAGAQGEARSMLGGSGGADGAAGPAGTDHAAAAQAPAANGGGRDGGSRGPDGADGDCTTAERGRLEALEATCSAVAQEDMEMQGAVACLVGRTGKYYLRGLVVTLGRATDSKGDVDLDVTPEEAPAARAEAAGGAGAAAAAGGDTGGGQVAAPGAPAPAGGGHRVCRRQAMVRLGPDGQFRLVNMGRQPVLVNDVTVLQNHTVTLPHLSLIEVASVRLLFMANLAAAARVVRRSAALVL